MVIMMGDTSLVKCHSCGYYSFDDGYCGYSGEGYCQPSKCEHISGDDDCCHPDVLMSSCQSCIESVARGECPMQ